VGDCAQKDRCCFVHVDPMRPQGRKRTVVHSEALNFQRPLEGRTCVERRTSVCKSTDHRLRNSHFLHPHNTTRTQVQRYTVERDVGTRAIAQSHRRINF